MWQEMELPTVEGFGIVVAVVYAAVCMQVEKSVLAVVNGFVDVMDAFDICLHS